MKIRNELLAVALPVISAPAFTAGGNHSNMAYQIEMHDQTNSQWLSPYLCALHHWRLSLFSFG